MLTRKFRMVKLLRKTIQRNIRVDPERQLVARSSSPAHVGAEAAVDSPTTGRLRNWPARAVTYALILPACVGAWYFGSLLAAGRHNNPDNSPEAALASTMDGLFIDSTALNLGELWEDPDCVRTLTVENRNDRRIEIVNFSTSCDCTSIEPRSLSLEPGQSREIRVKLDLMHRLPYQSG